MTAMLAGTAVTNADTLNVSFLRFHPETCLSGHDNIADFSADAGVANVLAITALYHTDQNPPFVQFGLPAA